MWVEFGFVDKSLTAYCFWLDRLQAADMVATKKVCIGIVQVCFFAGNYKLLNEHIVLLSKRRSQLKQVRAPVDPALFVILTNWSDLQLHV